MSNHRNTYTVDVKPSGNNRVKVAWWGPNGFICHYLVNLALLKKSAEDVRFALQKMVTAVRSHTDVRASLNKLAQAGRDLYDHLFTAAPDTPADARSASSMQNWLIAEPELIRITFNVTENVYIPWGLVYDGDPADLAQVSNHDPALSEYEAFWCVKYLVSVLYSSVPQAKVFQQRSSEDAEMLTIVHEGVWEKAFTALPTAEQTQYSGSCIRKNHRFTSSQDFFKKWKQSHGQVDLLYFYCHADATSLALSDTDEIQIRKFCSQLKRTSDVPVCIVFLNGCQTAVGNEDAGFLEATAGLGFAGFIGTEAKVPDVFALRFAHAFFHQLACCGKPVIDIVEELRSRFWPLSLLYTNSVHPQFRLKPTEQAHADFSFDPSHNVVSTGRDL